MKSNVRRRRSTLAAAGAVTAVIAAGTAILVHAPSSQSSDGFTPVMFVDAPAPENAADQAAKRKLPVEAPSHAAKLYLSPSESLAGRTAAKVVPSDYTVDHVVANRVIRDGILIGNDRALAVGPKTDRYLVTNFVAFAKGELALSGFTARPTPGGTYWVTSDDPDMQAVTFLSDAGIAVRIDHFSASADDRVEPGQLLTMAKAAARDLPPARPID